MKIVAQNYSDGKLRMLDVPGYSAKKGLLVETRASLVSAGTEKAIIDIARKGLIGKAISRPDWVRQVIDKVRTEGVMEAFRQSRARLDMPLPLGYSCAGVIRAVNGRAACGFRAGDRVALAGSGTASHSELNVALPNLCAHIPANVSFEDASYVALGGIAIEAARLAKPEFGHRVGVIGLGLLGQLAVQVLRAAGCHVIGFDISRMKCELAVENGAEAAAVTGADDPLAAARDFSRGEGLDSVVILASVDSNQPIEQAAAMCRERGRIIAGGLVGLEIPRKVFYEKELEFSVSRAWGPGMYDADYEERGVKYPLAYARWTAKRNMEEFLRMISIGAVRLGGITTHRFPFDKALDAYELLLSGREPAVGVVLDYKEGGDGASECLRVGNKAAERKPATGGIGIGLIGAGLFARGTFLPAMEKIPGFLYKGVSATRGLTAGHMAESWGFDYAATSHQEILRDERIDLVFILTRHDSHCRLLCEALEAGKAVFVEKPLCINRGELEKISKVYQSLLAQGKAPFLMAGFNRRFAPATVKCMELTGRNKGQSIVQIRCNAGYIPPGSWVHKEDEGGGRIIGEVCHFVDLAQAITGGLPHEVFAVCTESSRQFRDCLSVILKMDNGAVANILYAANGDKSFPREEVQVFAGGSVCVIDNFKNVRFFAGGGRRKTKWGLSVDRGYAEELRAVRNALKEGRPAPIDFRSIAATTAATFAIEESLASGQPVNVYCSEWGFC
ncbi:MAG: bi-domain-containing oxidoreductase [Nitrospiraceae bacterium]|nr:bi-domain-containing oxidoreductase [Nitrospiraceae bacterium]